MESTVHAHNSETPSVWTDEKHVNFLNTMEASFVRTMLHRRPDAPSNNHHRLRLDRHLPDSADSTLDSKPRSYKSKKHASASRDSTGSRARIASRRMRRTSSQLRNSSLADQEVPQLENGREDASCVAGHDGKDQRSYS